MSSVLLFLLSYTFLLNQKLNIFLTIQQAANSGGYIKHVLHLLPHHQGYVSSRKTHASSFSCWRDVGNGDCIADIPRRDP